jgi:hypothetical protein
MIRLNLKCDTIVNHPIPIPRTENTPNAIILPSYNQIIFPNLHISFPFPSYTLIRKLQII